MHDGFFVCIYSICFANVQSGILGRFRGGRSYQHKIVINAWNVRNHWASGGLGLRVLTE